MPATAMSGADSMSLAPFSRSGIYATLGHKLVYVVVVTVLDAGADAPGPRGPLPPLDSRIDSVRHDLVGGPLAPGEAPDPPNASEGWEVYGLLKWLRYASRIALAPLGNAGKTRTPVKHVRAHLRGIYEHEIIVYSLRMPVSFKKQQDQAR